MLSELTKSTDSFVSVLKNMSYNIFYFTMINNQDNFKKLKPFTQILKYVHPIHLLDKLFLIYPTALIHQKFLSLLK